MDPYEHAPTSFGALYDQWRVENVYLTADAVMKSAAFLETFVDYPPSQSPASFSIDQIRKSVDERIEAGKRTARVVEARSHTSPNVRTGGRERPVSGEDCDARASCVQGD